MLTRREKLRTGIEGTPAHITLGMHFYVVAFGPKPQELPHLVLSGTYHGTVIIAGETLVCVHLDGDPDDMRTNLPASCFGLDGSAVGTRLAVDDLDDLRVIDQRSSTQKHSHPI